MRSLGSTSARDETARQRVVWLAILLTVVGIQLAVYWGYQPRIALGNGRGDDGVHYGRLAEQFARAEPPEANAPFVYRIGVPWLASRLSLLSGLSIDASFQTSNLGAYLALIVVIYMFAIRFCSPPYAALACVLYSLPFFSYARLIYFYPVNVDTVWLVLVVWSLYLMTSPRLSPGILTLLCVLSTVATTIRENGIVVPIVFLLSRYPVRRSVSMEALLGVPVAPTSRDARSARVRDTMWGVVMLAGSLLAIGLTRLLCKRTGDYTLYSAILRTLENSSLWHVVVSLFLAFGGPLLGVVILKRQMVKRMLFDYPELGVYVAFTLLQGCTIGVTTVRIFGWASPVVLTAIAMGLEAAVAEAKLASRTAVKILRLGSLAGLLFLNIVIQHPFGGYFDDYTAFAQWGGAWFSNISSLKPILVCILAIGLMLWIWNATATDNKKGIPPQEVC